MRAFLIVVGIAAVCVLWSRQFASADDCTQRPTQQEQIACLQRTVDALQREIVQLSGRSAAFGRRAEGSLDDLIQRKIDEALRPRVQPVQ